MIYGVCARVGKGNERACTTSAASVGSLPISVIAIAISAAIAAAAGAAVFASATAAASVVTAAASVTTAITAASDCFIVAISLLEKILCVPLTWHYESEKGQGSALVGRRLCFCEQLAAPPLPWPSGLC